MLREQKERLKIVLTVLLFLVFVFAAICGGYHLITGKPIIIDSETMSKPVIINDQEYKSKIVWSHGNFGDEVEMAHAAQAQIAAGATSFGSATTAMHYDPRIFCPVCQEKGLKSSVYVGTSNTTLVYNPIWYDEEGNLQYANTNTTTIYYSCSQGHKWYEACCMGETRIEILKDTEDEIEETEIWDSSETILDTTEELSFLYTDDSFTWDGLLVDYGASETIIFGNDVGKITWKKGYMEFEGDADESAEIFFEAFLKPMIDGHIESGLEKEEPIELTIEEPEMTLIEFTTEGEFAKAFKPEWFLKINNTDLSRCFINNRLRINLNGEIY